VLKYQILIGEDN